VSTAFVAISVIFLYFQLKLSRDISIADFVMRIDEYFDSEKLVEIRKRIAKIGLKNNSESFDCLEILDFFEKIAYLEREGLISLDAIDEMWGYWIVRYWIVCRSCVNSYRKKMKDNSYYLLTEEMVERLIFLGNKKSKLANKKIKNKKVCKEAEEFYERLKIDGQLEEFIKEENSL